MRITASRHATLPTGLMFLLATGACQGGSNRARSGAADTTAKTDTGAHSAAPTTTPKGGLTDSNIVAVLDAANKADSAAGAVALKKATSPDVKAFANLMMSEHHALRAAGEDLAKQLGITPKPPERDPLAGYTRNEMATLQKTPKGPEFDRAYIDNEVAIHQAVLDFANQARVTTQTAELKDLIQKAIEVVRKHLELAQSIQKKIEPSA